jgi:hypothetical protein
MGVGTTGGRGAKRQQEPEERLQSYNGESGYGVFTPIRENVQHAYQEVTGEVRVRYYCIVWILESR